MFRKKTRVAPSPYPSSPTPPLHPSPSISPGRGEAIVHNAVLRLDLFRGILTYLPSIDTPITVTVIALSVSVYIGYIPLKGSRMFFISPKSLPKFSSSFNTTLAKLVACQPPNPCQKSWRCLTACTWVPPPSSESRKRTMLC